jgi:tetratricopeptide (TPR) repeat protein
MKKKPIGAASGKQPWEKYLLGAILLYVCFLFNNSLRNDILAFDDIEYFRNTDVRQLSWNSVKNIFSSYYLIMYQPLPVLSFALNYHFTGPETFPIHLVNLCFHLCNVLLVYRLVRALSSSYHAALLVALFFGIHPMNVEAVSWISARSSGMYTCFYLLAMLSYLRYIKNAFEMKYLLLTGLFFLLSLFSKAQAVTLPVVLLLLDFFYRRKLLSRKVLVEKAPFFFLSLVFGIITLLDKDTQSNLDSGVGTSYSLLDTFFIACHSLAFYLVKLVLPIKLCSIYVYPPKTGGFLPFVYYASVSVVALLFFFFYRVRRNREILFCLGLFLITIAINIQIIPSRLFQVADRYAYFPYIGLYMIPVFFLLNRPQLISRYKKHVIVVLAGFLLFFSFSVRARNKVWQNDEVLMSDIIKKNPPVWYIFRAHGNRALYYKRNGRLKEAIEDFDASIRLNPDDLGSYIGRGQSHFEINDLNGALVDFDTAIKLDPGQHVLYSYRSQVRYKMHDTIGALEDCRKGLALDSSNCDIYNTLAVIAYAQKNYDEAIKNLSMAIKYKPDMTVAILNRGLICQQTGRKEEACSDFQRAAQLGDQTAAKRYRQYCVSER